eukprot:10052979-Karenia_brevis.AAC.1
MEYKTVLQGRWRWDQEHINIKEGRVALMHVRRLCRSMKNYGKHHTFIGDNLVSLCCFEKGRARSWSLNVLCRRIAAYSMACQF